MPIASQEDYDKAKGLIDSGQAKNPARLQKSMQRFARFAMPQASVPVEGVGEGSPISKIPQSAPEEGQPISDTFGDEYLANSHSGTADVIRAAMDPAQLEARRNAVDMTRKLSRDDSLKTASKLKVFNNPPEYFPPTLPGNPLSSSLLKATTRYFEPTPSEFRQVIAEDKRLASKFRSEHPDVQDIEELPDNAIETSDAYKVYSDARWQHALADAVKNRTPITRVAYTDKDWMGGGQAKDDSGNPVEGQRKPSVADLMDGTMAAGVGSLQGGSLGGYDLGLTAGGATDLRDAGRGSMNRHPVLGTIGEVAGALHPRSLSSRLVGGLGTLGRPTSLLGRAAKGAAVGATMAVIDENLRSAAKLAADAIDANDSAAELIHRLHGLPGIQGRTALAGGALGAAADVLGAGAGRLAKGAPRALGLKEPLEHLEASGGQVNMLGTAKRSPRAQAWANRGAKARATAQDLISEGAVQPMARQVMLEQEAAKRGAELETNIAQAKLEGVDLPTKQAASAIRADAGAIKPITQLAKNQQKQLLQIADDLAKSETVSAETLDNFIGQLDDAAGQGKANKEPIEHLNNASRHLRDLRDKFAHADEKTVADVPPVEDKGLFTAEPDATIAEPQARRIAGIRDSEGNVNPTEGYAALKAQQYKDRTLQEFKTASILGNRGKPRKLTAEPVISEPIVDKGLFNPETPAETVSKIKPKILLDKAEHEALKGNIRKIARPDDAADADEILSLGRRVGRGMERKLRIIQQLDDADRLDSALGHAINGVSSRGGGLAAFVNRKQLFRTVPTLKGLSGGLPTRGTTPEANSWSVNRLKEFVRQFPDRLPKAAKAGIEGARRGLGSSDVQNTFMPNRPSLGLRAGLPTRGIGAALDKPSQTKEPFSKEERDFWLAVVNNLSENHGAD